VLTHYKTKKSTVFYLPSPSISLRFLKRVFAISLLIISLLLCNQLASARPNFTTPTNNYNVQQNDLTVVADEKLVEFSSYTFNEILIESEVLWFDDIEKSKHLIRNALAKVNLEEYSDTIKARVYHLLGKTLVEDRNKEKTKIMSGLDSLLKCIDIKKRCYGDGHLELAKTYNYLGIAYFKLRQYGQAEVYYKNSAQILIENNAINRSYYDANLNLGIVNAIYGQYDTAYDYFNTASYVLDSIGSSVDSVLVARFHLNYGLLSTLMGKFDDAIQHYSIAELIYKEIYGPNNPRIATINNNMGTNAYYKYDYTRALLYFKEALNIFIEADMDIVDVPKSYNNLSSVSMKTASYTESVQYCLSGLESVSNNYIELLLLQNLASSYAYLGNNDKAEYYYLVAIDLLRSTPVEPAKQISLYIEYADFLDGIKQFEKSKTFYEIALQILNSQQLRDSKLYATLLGQFGDYYRHSRSNMDSALIYYNRAIVAWNNILVSVGTAQQESFDDIRFLDAYLGKAQVLLHRFNEEQRIELLQESFDIYEWALEKAIAITGNLDSENQLLLNEQLENAYKEVIHIAYNLHLETSDSDYKDMAFKYAEHSKSSVLLAAVQNNNALKTTDVPQEVVEMEQQIQLNINGMKKLLLDEQTKEKPVALTIEFINSRLLQLMDTYDSLVDQIEQNYPLYFGLKYDKSVVELAEVKDKLMDDEVLLEYVLSDSLLTMFCIGNNINHFSQTKVDTVFAKALHNLVSIRNTNISNQRKHDLETFVADANTLWNYLVSPVCEQIQGKKLIIVPDGLLGYLSFDLLLASSQVPGEIDYKALPYLFKEFPLSYSYSSSLRYNSFFQSKETNAEGLIAFAPDNNLDRKGRTGLGYLPFSANEVLEVNQVYGGESYLDANATKSRFLSDAVNYRIVHLAMHTVINDTLPMFSELLFYADNKDADSFNSKLHTYELFGLDLAAELVVLSACNTGTGRLQKGEGIMSLARGFIYSGVPSIVMTLWEAQDLATAGIMKQFYLNLKTGDRKDVALQKAKMDFLANANRLKSHPYYWSSFLVAGETRSIEDNYKRTTYTHWIIYAGILFLVLLIIATFIKKKERKKT